MVIGEFISENLQFLFDKEKRIKQQYKNYCLYHQKQTVFEYLLNTQKLEFILKFKLENNGNNGEISNS